jgi:hypothetical protein
MSDTFYIPTCGVAEKLNLSIPWSENYLNINHGQSVMANNTTKNQIPTKKGYLELQ